MNDVFTRIGEYDEVAQSGEQGEEGERKMEFRENKINTFDSAFINQ